MNKVPQSSALYFPAAIIAIGGANGAACGRCRSLDPLHDTICHQYAWDQGEVSAAHGVCGLYVPGVPMGEGCHALTKAMTGYVETAPTRCGNCEYIRNGPGLGPNERLCAKVEGYIEPGGCCGLWEKG